jgi:hypothetical protein
MATGERFCVTGKRLHYVYYSSICGRDDIGVTLH